MMKKIQVLGPGCPRCTQLAAAADLAAKQLGLEYEIEKVTDISEIVNLGVMMTPGLIVDGELKFQGKCPSVDELKEIIA
jgi:small redox-active disulfide protein 2